MSLKQDLLDDATWSDDELDYLENIAAKQNLSNTRTIIPTEILGSKGNKTKHKIFSGKVKVTPCQTDNDKKCDNFEIRLPYIPPHVYEVLGREVVETLWCEFINYGADESELILTKHVADIEVSAKKLGFTLPFDELDMTEDGDEHIDFSYLIDKLAVCRNKAGVVKPVREEKIQLPPCCSTKACFIHCRNEMKVLSTGDERPDFRLDVVYRRWVLNKKGNVRVNDVPSILADADIQHDRELAPELFWIVNGDLLLVNYEMLQDVAQKIRLDKEDIENQLDLYRLPRWLQNEFTPQEIAMFRHHFMMIDVDQGGSIDAEELQLLGQSLGNKISQEEAEHLIAEYDDDNSGSIDFEEFMGLMFKILHGTVDVENDKLGSALMESRSQLKLFQEIESIKESPPDYVSIKQYGGNPVECEYYLEGPAGSLYEGGTFVLKVVYLNGYPYRCPECFMTTRIMGLNMITQTNGFSVFPHIKHIWDTSWDSRRLLGHILDLMVEPNPSYLDPEFVALANSFLMQNFEVTEDDSLITSAFGVACVTPDTFKERLKLLPRLSQMHLNIVVLFVSNREKYEAVVREYVSNFANKT